MTNIKSLLKTAEKFVKNTREGLSSVVIGQAKVKDLILISVLSNGHSIITGVPGLAKTMLIRNLAKLFALEFKRIQFTPDLMPSDIIGAEIIDLDSNGKKHFRLYKGPIFANMILADEINRTPPKTQSALLQAMEEKIVSIGGETHQLPHPFFVFATQNPIEQEGTYPLPEAELDRFLFNIEITYPESADEFQIAKRYPNFENIELKAAVKQKDLVELIKGVEDIGISEESLQRIIRIVQSTRPANTAIDHVKKYVLWGAGPRASQYLAHAAKANAMIKGHAVVSDGDIDELLFPVLKHRIILNFAAQAEGVGREEIISKIVEKS